MTFWPLTNSDFPTDQTFHQFHILDIELDLHWSMSGFHWAFATGVASQQGTLTLPDTWFRPPFWDLLMLQLLRPNSTYLPCLYSTFHLEYPLVLSRFCCVWRHMFYVRRIKSAVYIGLQLEQVIIIIVIKKINKWKKNIFESYIKFGLAVYTTLCSFSPFRLWNVFFFPFPICTIYIYWTWGCQLQ